ncbi:Hypothetical predicted protein [Xyrichtys novacula]|uniref:Uncharacterized protein n=1 Tax=Xyrichtys novacula TaxID=13765 RepID=A0AAV1G8N5_XYRNO|nr:Hypothetical predicted protein [Xyrichtys novacula]
MSPPFQFFSKSVCVVFIDPVPAAAPFFLFYCPFYLPPFLSPGPSSAVFIKFSTKEKKRAVNISKNIRRFSLVGDCRSQDEVNCPSFIYQTRSVYVRAECNVKNQTLGLKDEV